MKGLLRYAWIATRNAFKQIKEFKIVRTKFSTEGKCYMKGNTIQRRRR